MAFPHGIFDAAQSRNPDKFGKVEAETVHAVAFNHPKQAVDNEAFTHRAVGAVIVPATAPIGKVAVKIEIEIIVFIDAEKMIRFADVIVNDVENHGEALLVKCRYKIAKFFDLARICRIARVGGCRRKPIRRHVAPMIIFGFKRIKLLNRLKFHGVHAEFFQITIVGAHPFREISKTDRTLQVAEFRMPRNQIAQMHFRNNQIRKMRRCEFFRRIAQVIFVDNNGGTFPGNAGFGIRIQDRLAGRERRGVIAVSPVDKKIVMPSVKIPGNVRFPNAVENRFKIGTDFGQFFGFSHADAHAHCARRKKAKRR